MPPQKKLVIGYIFTAKKAGREERMFLRLAKKKNIEIVMINLFKRIEEEEFEKKIRKCDLVYNNTAEDFVIESLKTVEELGKKVIDTSQLYYYTEDKWMFYLKCREHKIPTLETILLSHNLNIARAELKEFGQWPVILKRVYGTMGEFVEKADNLSQAVDIIKKFQKMDCDKLPVIAQEFVQSFSYRVTIIDKKIVQTALKKSKNWKCTGVFGKTFDKFRVDSDLKKILNKVIRFVKINICGVDLLKKNGKWLVLEVNTNPALDFIEEKHEHLVDLVLTFLKKYHRLHMTRPKATRPI
jgi:glutathione synthase/RimK-type ligase-like ATP-grasp enzyme